MDRLSWSPRFYPHSGLWDSWALWFTWTYRLLPTGVTHQPACWPDFIITGLLSTWSPILLCVFLRHKAESSWLPPLLSTYHHRPARTLIGWNLEGSPGRKGSPPGGREWPSEPASQPTGSECTDPPSLAVSLSSEPCDLERSGPGSRRKQTQWGGWCGPCPGAQSAQAAKQILQTEGLNSRSLLLTFQEAGSPRSRCLLTWFLGRALSLGEMNTFSVCPHMAERQGSGLSVSFFKGTNPSWWPHPHNLI